MSRLENLNLAGIVNSVAKSLPMSLSSSLSLSIVGHTISLQPSDQLSERSPVSTTLCSALMTLKSKDDSLTHSVSASDYAKEAKVQTFYSQLLSSHISGS